MRKYLDRGLPRVSEFRRDFYVEGEVPALEVGSLGLGGAISV